MRWLVLISSSILLASCATAPLTSGLSAASHEVREVEVQAQWAFWRSPSLSYPAPSVRAVAGLGGHWDVAVQTELKSFSVTGKYSFLESEDKKGLALAALGGLVFYTGELSYLLGGVGSWRFESWEPSLTVRFNIARLDRTRTDISFFRALPLDGFSFMSFHLGLKYWLTAEVILGAELIGLVSASSVSFNAPFGNTLFVSFVF